MMFLSIWLEGDGIFANTIAINSLYTNTEGKSSASCQIKTLSFYLFRLYEAFGAT